MRAATEKQRLPRGFMGSCRKFRIPENKARELAEAFREELDYYPRTFGEALIRGCE